MGNISGDKERVMALAARLKNIAETEDTDRLGEIGGISAELGAMVADANKLRDTHDALVSRLSTVLCDMEQLEEDARAAMLLDRSHLEEVPEHGGISDSEYYATIFQAVEHAAHWGRVMAFLIVCFEGEKGTDNWICNDGPPALKMGNPRDDDEDKDWWHDWTDDAARALRDVLTMGAFRNPATYEFDGLRWWNETQPAKPAASPATLEPWLPTKSERENEALALFKSLAVD